MLKELAEITKGLSQPLVKLIEVCSTGIGKFYEPTHIKRIAKADAEAYRILSEAIEQSPIIPSVIKDGKLSMDASDCDVISIRIKERVAFQEFKKQVNIENVISKAYCQLKDEEKVSSDSVDEDWVTRFFNYVGEVSNEEMQFIWGSILAGEIKETGSFSLRTIDVLRNMSKNEAQTFNRLSSLIMKSIGEREHYQFIYYELEILKHFNIDLFDIVKLTDIGLISQELLYKNTQHNKIKTAVYGNQLITIQCTDNKCNYAIPVKKLTKAGEELYSITGNEINIEYFNSLQENFKNRYKSNLEIGSYM